jgi:hypothetical protein
MAGIFSYLKGSEGAADDRSGRDFTVHGEKMTWWQASTSEPTPKVGESILIV